MRQINTITDENGEEFEIADKKCREEKLDKSALPKNLSAFHNDKEFIDKTAANLENYYKKAETYTREEIDELLSQRLNFEVVDELPTEGIGLSTIYLVKKGSGGNGKPSDVYCEYIYADGKWELIGDTDIDLSNYYTKAEADEQIKKLSENYYTKEETDGRIQELSESGKAANQELLQGLNALVSNLGKEASDRQAADDGLGARIDGVERGLSAAANTASDNKARLDKLLKVTEERVDEETGETVEEPAGEGSLETMLKKATSEAVAKIVANAPESLDTLEEISDWISSHADDASAMNTQISANKAGLEGVSAKIPSAASPANQLADKNFVNEKATELDTKITNGLTTVNGLKQDKFDSEPKTDLSPWITDVSEYCEKLKVMGMKRSGIIFLDVSFTTKFPVNWSTQNLFTLTSAKWQSAFTTRLPALFAYYKEGDVLKAQNLLVDKAGSGGDSFRIGENDAPPGGEVRGMLIYPALQP